MVTLSERGIQQEQTWTDRFRAPLLIVTLGVLGLGAAMTAFTSTAATGASFVGLGAADFAQDQTFGKEISKGESRMRQFFKNLRRRN